MNYILQGDKLIISLNGKVDSTNAAKLEAEIMALCEQTAYAGMTLDFKALEYISSAGLRILLRLRKKEKNFEIINVSGDVYEILDMTGFTEIMTVSKAYRQFSVEGCEVLGQGANGIVYRYDQDTAVKVYKRQDCLPDVKRERELARKALVLGVPTAIPYDVVQVGDRYASVFELLNSKSFSKLIAADPDNMDEYVAKFVDLMKTIHGTHVKPGEMPSEKEVVLSWARFVRDHLPAEQGQKCVELVEAVPEMDTMIHGDYHTNNIVVQNNEVLLIDMDTLCVGHPIFELASVFMAFVGFGETDPSITSKFLKLPYELTTLFWKKALRAYLDTDDEARILDVENKARVICYMRLMRRTIRRDGFNNDEGRNTIALCRKHLDELLPLVDTLTF